MKLIVDIGNTNVVLAFCVGEDFNNILRLLTIKDGEAEQYYDYNIRTQLLELSIATDDLAAIYVSSVVPDLNDTLVNILHSIFGIAPFLLKPEDFKKIKLSIDTPSEIGMDLVANAVAAISLHDTDCIVIDFGTALTFTTIHKDYELLGVAIAPGLKTSIGALHQKTAQLPEVPLELPTSVIGKNSTHAIQSGVLWGYIGLVKEISKRICEEQGRDYKIIATGGLSSILHPLEDMLYTVDSTLTLKGIKIIGDSLSASV